MSKTLIIAEKPSVANDLAKVLGKFQKEEGFFENDRYVISSAVGHLLEMHAPDSVEVKRGKWKLENLPVLPTEFDLTPIEKNKKRFNLLKKLIKRKDVSELINACDAGREGELIFRNIIKSLGAKKPMQRLWLQSMTREAILKAFENLRSDEQMQPLADAALSRSESDWLVGINSTRALTAFNTAHVGGFQMTPAGRVQTPTLAILVEREEKIRAFKSRQYVEVFGDFAVSEGNYRGRWFDENFKKGDDEDARAERLWESERAAAIKEKCEGRPGEISEEKKPTTQMSPLLYDLTSLQREANGRFGFSARRTLQLAQQLYERYKVLSYPRTDSRYLPEDNLNQVRKVMGQFQISSLSKHAEKALAAGWVKPTKRIFNNAKISDHHAIIPTGTPLKTEDEALNKLYDLVSRRFIAVFYPPAQFEITTRITRVEGEAFKTDGKIIVDPGWLAVYGRRADSENESDKAIVAISEGEKAQTEAIEIKENETKPPARFNEATLLGAMEGAGKFVDDDELRDAMREKGLGTPATRASIIEGLLFQGYIERKARDLIAAAKGISLITLLRNLGAADLCKPELTGEWEFKLKQVELGKMKREEFMQQIRDLTTSIVGKVKAFGDKPIEGEFQTLEIECPKCKGGPFKEDYRTYTCAGCGLRIWKSIAAREFEPEEIRTLLTNGEVGPLEGFISKMGRKFSAKIKLGEEFKPTFDFDDDANSEPVDLSQAPVIGDCPHCKKGKVYELERTFACENGLPPKKECTFRVGHTILQKQITVDQITKLIANGKTDLLAGFVSKKGRKFSAYLVLDPKTGKVGFEFEPRKAKPKAAAKSK